MGTRRGRLFIDKKLLMITNDKKLQVRKVLAEFERIKEFQYLAELAKNFVIENKNDQEFIDAIKWALGVMQKQSVLMFLTLHIASEGKAEKANLIMEEGRELLDELSDIGPPKKKKNHLRLIK